VNIEQVISGSAANSHGQAGQRRPALADPCGKVPSVKKKSCLHFFNDFSASFGLRSSPIEGINFYLILAIGYMYLVAMLAWFMSRQPENRLLPVLLLNAKLASSILSLVFFFAVNHALIYLANGVIDGLIGAGVLFMYRKQRRLE
jgi:hypothetical protein